MMKHFCSEYRKHFKVKSIMQKRHQNPGQILLKNIISIVGLLLSSFILHSLFTVTSTISIADLSLSGFNIDRVIFRGLIVNRFCPSFAICWLLTVVYRLSAVNCLPLLSFVVVGS
jgi:hypothetical protein